MRLPINSNCNMYAKLGYVVQEKLIYWNNTGAREMCQFPRNL